MDLVKKIKGLFNKNKYVVWARHPEGPWEIYWEGNDEETFILKKAMAIAYFGPYRVTTRD